MINDSASWLPTIVNVCVAILVPMVGALVGLVFHIQGRLHALELKVATDYSALPAKLDKLTQDLESFRREFSHEFMPLLNQIKGSFSASKGQ